MEADSSYKKETHHISRNFSVSVLSFPDDVSNFHNIRDFSFFYTHVD